MAEPVALLIFGGGYLGRVAALEAIRLLAEEDHHHSLLTAKEIDEDFSHLTLEQKKVATKS